MKTVTLPLHDYTYTFSEEVIEAITAGATSESHEEDHSLVVMTFKSKAKADAFAAAIGHASEAVEEPVHDTVAQDDTGE